MGIGLLYWILMIIWLVFGVWRDYPDWKPMGGSFLQFILFLLLGWGVFGPPIHG